MDALIHEKLVKLEDEKPILGGQIAIDVENVFMAIRRHLENFEQYEPEYAQHLYLSSWNSWGLENQETVKYLYRIIHLGYACGFYAASKALGDLRGAISGADLREVAQRWLDLV